MALLDTFLGLTLAYRLRWKRRRLLFRCWRKRRQLKSIVDRTAEVEVGHLKAFLCAKNEILRLPWWLDYYRALGVKHFYCVVNASDDGTLDYLCQQTDCSVWVTDASYKASRFGMDWLGLLLYRYGHNSWCLTVDADELLTFPHVDTRSLTDLTAWLDSTGRQALGAQLLDLYPEGRLSSESYPAGDNPLKTLTHYDAWNTTHILQKKQGNQWIQGGPRARMFFSDRPERAPTLNKVPLVKWNRTYVYVTSTHILLPSKLNNAFDARSGLPVIGCLLHTKFLDDVVDRSADPDHKAEHFENSSLYQEYYDQLTQAPTLWIEDSKPYRGWKGLAEDGILWRCDWGDNP